jgi:hypothetical protein
VTSIKQHYVWAQARVLWGSWCLIVSFLCSIL